MKDTNIYKFDFELSKTFAGRDITLTLHITDLKYSFLPSIT